jgi:pyruvyltransferase
MRLFKSKTIKAYWWNSRPNFGDALAPLLLRYYADLDVEWDTVSRASIVTIGSVLEHIPPLWDGYVLGAGQLYEDSHLYLYGQGTNVLALRGPLSKRSYPGDCAIGDPGLLAYALVPTQERMYDLGILPHWTDGKLIADRRFINDKWSHIVIDPTDDPLSVIRNVARCKKIVTSSLHGAVIADSLGIPRRIEYTKRFDSEGGVFKFRDYHQSIGMKFELGVTAQPNMHHVETRQDELWDAYRDLGTLIRG